MYLEFPDSLELWVAMLNKFHGACPRVTLDAHILSHGFQDFLFLYAHESLEPDEFHFL
jgi:hypothetical protein